MKRLLVVLMSLVLGVHLNAQQEEAPAQTQSSTSDYRIASQDVIKVDVFGEPELSNQELRVSARGDVSFPLVDVVQVAGKTPQEVERLLEELLNKDYLVEPDVTVTVKAYRARTMSVMGAVNKPGAIELPAEEKLTIIDAIARAGGLSKLADDERIEFTSGGKTTKYRMGDLKKETNPSKIIYVKETDLINVLETRF